MSNKRNGFANEIKVVLLNGERMDFNDKDRIWFYEFKPNFLEVCSNGERNSNPYNKTRRTLIPLINIRNVDLIEDSSHDDSLPTRLEGSD